MLSCARIDLPIDSGAFQIEGLRHEHPEAFGVFTSYLFEPAIRESVLVRFSKLDIDDCVLKVDAFDFNGSPVIPLRNLDLKMKDLSSWIPRGSCNPINHPIKSLEVLRFHSQSPLAYILFFLGRPPIFPQELNFLLPCRLAVAFPPLAARHFGQTSLVSVWISQTDSFTVTSVMGPGFFCLEKATAGFSITRAMQSTQPTIQSAPHTDNHIDCPACREYLHRLQEPAAVGRMRFREAAPLWLKEHSADISAKTRSDYEYYIRCLERFFGELPLEQIHLGHINAYIDERRASAGASCINHEINTVKQILDHAGLWSEIEKFYKPLRLPKCLVGRAMEPEDEKRLFQVASTSPRWKVAYWCSILTATTTAGPKEITHLHLNDIELGERSGAPFGTLRIRDGLKNGYRERVVPMNASSQWALGQILGRYFKICKRLRIKSDIEHYILPGRERSKPYDPEKPMGSWKKAWGSLRTAAAMPDLRMYDLRHHAITKLMEDPDVSEQTIEEMAGHALSSRMKKRYSHIRMKPKAEATLKLELQIPKKPAQSVRSDGQVRAVGKRGDYD